MPRLTARSSPPPTGPPLKAAGARQEGIAPTVLARHLVVFYVDDPPPWSTHVALHGIEAGDQALIPQTPRIAALAEDGVTFLRGRNAPVCTPGRASLLTGVRSDRHGLGTVVSLERGSSAMSEFGDPGYDLWPTLPSRLPVDVHTVMLGKTHLSLAVEEDFTHSGSPGIGWDVMYRLGFDEWWTQLRNTNQLPVPDGAGGTAGASEGTHRRYYSSRGGNAERESLYDAAGAQDEYQTTAAIDELLAVFDARAATQRIFAYVPLTATHGPYDPRLDDQDNPKDFPPDALVGTQEYLDLRDAELAGDEPLGIWPTYMAQMEAVDAEIGRFLDSLDPQVRRETTVVVAGDNGFENNALPAGSVYGKVYPDGWEAVFAAQAAGTPRLKGSLYYLGTAMQLVWTGPARWAWRLPTAGTTSLAPITIEDLHETIVEYFSEPTIFGPESTTDGVSFLRHLEEGIAFGRTQVITQQFYPTGDWTLITHGVYKDVEDDDPLRPQRLEQRVDRLVLAGEVASVTADGWYGLLRRWTTEHHFDGGGALVLDGDPAWSYELYRTFGGANELEDGGLSVFELEPLDLVEYADLLAFLEAELVTELGSGLSSGADFMFIDHADASVGRAYLNEDGSCPVELASGAVVQWDADADGIDAELVGGVDVYFEVGQAEATGDKAVPIDHADGTTGTWVLDVDDIAYVDLADGSTGEVDGIDPGGGDPVYIPCELDDTSVVEWDTETI